MKATKGRPANPPPGDPLGFAALLAEHLDWLGERNYSAITARNRGVYVGCLSRWCEERDLARPSEVTKPILELYRRHLYAVRKRSDGKPLSARGRHAHLVAVRAFFKWLCRKDYLLHNPASELELPRLERRLPKHVLSSREAELILALPDVSGSSGLRDRAMLETLYSTGIRRGELAGLKLGDLDGDRGTLAVRQGKGKKDRMVPVGERAASWIGKYEREARPLLAASEREESLFLSDRGHPLKPDALTRIVGGYVEAAGIGKTGSCHLFRHACATLMHENGADIRFVQQMLGHAELSTTQIYTQVAIRKLQQVHAATHPASCPKRPATAED